MSTYKFTKGKKRRELRKMATETVKHLKGISNQNVTMPIVGIKNILTVAKLIPEVEKLTGIGLAYINVFFGTQETIKKIRKGFS